MLAALYAWIIQNAAELTAATLAVAASTSIFNLLHFVARARDSIVPYNVAVLGLPRSGKTTLITSLFQVIFFHKFFGDRLLLRGPETIDRVNRDIETIKLGKALGPTTDQDMFAYRADIKRSSWLRNVTYRIAIGDFAGERSAELMEQRDDVRLHQTTFFRWVMEADAFIFVIDVAAYLRDGAAYVARVESEFRSAWQHLAEFHVVGGKAIKHKPVALVLNKCDVLVHSSDFDDVRVAKDYTQADNMQDVWRLGFGDETPPVVRLDTIGTQVIREFALSNFKPLVEYFAGQSAYFKVFPVSSFALVGEKPLGVEELAVFVLPG
ncbi:MAG TPA: GTPase domain-containing protein [Stellaceae bacterium]|nr:GTPase domain-containing protein [Stellaceae bacterium]